MLHIPDSIIKRIPIFENSYLESRGKLPSESLYSKKKLLLPPLSLKMGRWTTKKLTALGIPNLAHKLPFRWGCAGCLLQRLITNGGPARGPIILNLRKFFTDCFQNLAQRFIGIQRYINDIVLKEKGPGAPWGAP